MIVREPRRSERSPSDHLEERAGAAPSDDELEWDLEAAQQALRMLDRKWVVAIIRALWFSACRKGELRVALGHVSDKVLTETLRFLEHDGIVSRVAVEAMPPYFCYELTPLGYSLRWPLQALTLWTMEHPIDCADSAYCTGPDR